MSRRKRARGRLAGWTNRAGLALLALPLTVLAAGPLGIRLNVSTSLPPGLYRVVGAPIEVGRIVRFCPADTPEAREARRRGYLSPGICEGDYSPLLKRVAAMAGDHVRFEVDGVYINGARYAHSTRHAADPLGRPLPVPGQKEVTLVGQAFLPLSDYTEASYDGRYFGPEDRGAILEVVAPLWVSDRRERLQH